MADISDYLGNELAELAEMQHEDVKIPIIGEAEEASLSMEGATTYFVDENGQYYAIDPNGVAVIPDDKDASGMLEMPGSSMYDADAVGLDFDHIEQEPLQHEEQQPENDEEMTEAQPDEPEEVDEKPFVVPTTRAPSRRLAEKKNAAKNAERTNLAVYDFDEDADEDGEEEGELGEQYRRPESGDEDAEEDVKPSLARPAATKRAQNKSVHHACQYCNYTTNKRYLLSRHLKTHSADRPHKCSVCERGFKTLASLQNHVNTHTGTKPHKCRYCEAAFTTSGELVRHVRYRHTLEKPHQCTECDYSTVELSKLKRHMRAHTGERPYQCPHCTYASPDTFKLKRHLRIHTGEKPYECDMCHARFTQSNSLKAHRLIHTGNKPMYKCELCPATCGRKTDLRIHVQKLHMSEKPIKCSRCGKSFPDRYAFKQHSKTHEGEKCFKCDMCNYASASQRHLESHMLVHTDQKPFQCEICNQSFRQKQLLKRHLNLYHNPHYVPPAPKDKTHECPECTKCFRHKGNLMRHMESHDPESTVSKKREQTLKMERYKKMGLPTDDDGDEGGSNIVQLEGKDGERFVVLEVIEMDEDGPVVRAKRKVKKEPQDELFPPEEDEEDEEEEVEDEEEEEEEEGEEEEEEEVHQDVKEKAADLGLDPLEDEVRASRVGEEGEAENGGTVVKADLSNCFGFDEEEEDGD